MGATTKINYHIRAPVGSHFLDFFDCLMEKSVYLKHVPFFLEFWVALSALGDGRICNPSTLVQSKHTFHFLHFSQKRFHGESSIGQFGVMLHQKNDVSVTNNFQKTASKKGVPPISNKKLFTGQEAPREAASRTRCSDKKQFFEQQLKHYSKFWHKKVIWVQICCKSLTGLLNRCKKKCMNC